MQDKGNVGDNLFTSGLKRSESTDFTTIADKVVNAVVHIKASRMADYGDPNNFQYRQGNSLPEDNSSFVHHFPVDRLF